MRSQVKEDQFSSGGAAMPERGFTTQPIERQSSMSYTLGKRKACRKQKVSLQAEPIHLFSSWLS